MPSYQNSPILGPFYNIWLTKRLSCTALSIVQALKMLDIVIMELTDTSVFVWKTSVIQIASKGEAILI